MPSLASWRPVTEAPQLPAPRNTFQPYPEWRMSRSEIRERGGAYGYLFRTNLTCGMGASYSELTTKPTVGCGVGANMFVIFHTEFGVMGPQAHQSSISGYMTNDLIGPINWGKRMARLTAGHPVIFGGYTRMFETGHALDFGIGFERHLDGYRSLQVELRDYVAFANPVQHNVMLRVGYLVGLPD